MTPEERARAFNAAARAEARRLPKIQRETLQELIAQLQKAEASIVEALRAHPSESAQRRLRALQQEIERTIGEFQRAATLAANQGADAAWSAAANSMRAPAEAAGIVVNALGPRLDAAALVAAKSFMTDRIKDLSLRTLDKLNGALIQHLAGVESLSDTVTAVQRILHGATRSRAMTVTYTEIGRAYSVAHQAALERDAKLLPNLKKRWLKSGKLHPRATHVAVHNQIVGYDQPYIVAGEALLFPRDPAGSPGNTINCGCHSIPVVDGSTFGASTVRIDAAGDVTLEGKDGAIRRPPRPPKSAERPPYPRRRPRKLPTAPRS